MLGEAMLFASGALSRLGRVEDISPWIEFLLSPGSSFVTGQVITIDGGASV